MITIYNWFWRYLNMINHLERVTVGRAIDGWGWGRGQRPDEGVRMVGKSPQAGSWTRKLCKVSGKLIHLFRFKSLYENIAELLFRSNIKDYLTSKTFLP